VGRAPILHELIAASFERPQSLGKLVDEKITRNRSLRSSERRELSDLFFDLIRWRRRIFGDIAPSRIDLDQLQIKLSEARQLRTNPPLAKWAQQSIDTFAREVSFPSWIIDAWVHSLGFQSAASLALSLNEAASVTIRTNALKTTREKLKKELRKEDVNTEEGKLSPWALILQNRANLRGLKSFKSGLFEVQDEGSQWATLASRATAGEQVVDACAGAGGKTLAMAMMMENTGKIYSLDADSRKIPELKTRAKRAGVKICDAKWVAADDPHPLADLAGKIDRVLVDAPCSSLGTLRRKPWLKWESSSTAAESLGKKQVTLLTRYSDLLKAKGVLTYVTCTIHPAENEKVIDYFSKERPAFRLEDAPRTLRPDVEGCDGFFIAKFQRD
jgi:16S rRNA (cytosine967-C5)-methyltransferase